MLNAASAAEERVTTMHRAKLAYVYVRQSSPGQVRQHQERYGAPISFGRTRHSAWLAERTCAGNR